MYTWCTETSIQKIWHSLLVQFYGHHLQDCKTVKQTIVRLHKRYIKCKTGCCDLAFCLYAPDLRTIFAT